MSLAGKSGLGIPKVQTSEEKGAYMDAELMLLFLDGIKVYFNQRIQHSAL